MDMNAPMADGADFIVNRKDLRQTAIVPARDASESALGAGQVLLHVDRFAFTANNVTYGVVGELIGYWSFFPAREGWGRIPVWGYAEIARSRHQGLTTGERIYGYLPMSTHLIVQPDHVTAASFVDASPHRAALPPVYNQYVRIAADPNYDPAREAELALFRPLFVTAFLLDDFLTASGFFAARSAVLSSASSKTALGLAFLLARSKRANLEIVGLTSRRNREFVERTGYYDRVLSYEDLGALSREQHAVLVDFAGNGAIVKSVHERLGASLAYSCSVGLTHWDRPVAGTQLPGPAPVLFFAPDHVKRRATDWGMAGLQARVGQAMREFLDSTARWLSIVDGYGPAAVEAVYRAALEGTIDPTEGNMLSLNARVDSQVAD
jgi:hypothetical protein